MSDTNDDPGTIRPFADFIREQRNGSLHQELSERINELAAAVDEHGKAGTLTLVIKIAPSNADGMLVVSDDVKPNPPKAERGGAYFYVDADKNLRREDPRQLKFESLREVAVGDEGDPVVVDIDTGEVRSI